MAKSNISPNLVAKKIMDTASSLGWSVQVRGSILTIQKRIEKNNNAAFVKADGEYYSILELLPSTRAGSVWGTDGGGIGALTAINHGLFTMHKSGGSLRVLKAIEKIQSTC